MGSRDEYVRRLQEKLGEWNAEIDVLAGRAAQAGTGMKKELEEQIAVLKAKQAAAGEKIDELQQSGESAWEDLKSGAELAWTALGEAIDSAKSRFK